MIALAVHLHDEVIGHLHGDDALDYTFTYATSAKEALSCSLPLQAAAFDRQRSKAFFRGLLPEERRREKLSQQLQIEPDDDIALLAAIGGDCAGAVQILPHQQRIALEDLRYEIDDRARFCDDVRAGMLVTKEARLSLTGAQLKEPVVLADNGTIRIPRDGRPTTHILKVPRQPGTNDGYEDVVLNEYLCMMAAHRLSNDQRGPMFEVASVSLMPFTHYRGGSEDHILCVQRFDRDRDDHGVLRRVHQEDFCQATSNLQRYASQGGPTFATLGDICNTYTASPGINRLKIFYAALYNFLIGNCDAHGRNFSLHHRQGQKPELTPLYDLVSTTAYAGLSRNLSMPLTGIYAIDEIRMEHFTGLAKTLKLAPRTAITRARVIAENAEHHLHTARAEIDIDSTVLDEMLKSAVNRLHQLLQA